MLTALTPPARSVSYRAIHRIDPLLSCQKHFSLYVPSLRRPLRPAQSLLALGTPVAPMTLVAPSPRCHVAPLQPLHLPPRSHDLSATFTVFFLFSENSTQPYHPFSSASYLPG